MSLRIKLLLMLFATLTIYGFVDYSFHVLYINKSFLEQEQIQAQEHIEHALTIINYEAIGIDLLCHDWASWDDTYQFIQSRGKDRKYIKSNLGQSTFRQNNLDIISYFDIKNDIIWKDYRNRQPILLPQIDWAAINQSRDQQEKFTGFITTTSGPILISCRPITDSDESAKINGYLIMGRLMTGDNVIQMAKRLHGIFKFLPIYNVVLLSPVEIERLLNTDRIATKVEKKSLNIYKSINNLQGKPVIMLRLTVNRKGTLHGLSMINYNSLSNVIAGFITVGLFILFIRSNVIKPISSLTNHVNSINTADDLSTFPLETPKHDEIGILWQGFNQMVQRVQRNRLRMIAAEESLRGQQNHIQAILDTAPDGIITVDQNGIIESHNYAAARMFNYTENSLVGASIAILAQDEHAEQLLAVLQNYPETGNYKCFDSGCEMAGKMFDNSSLPVHMRASSVNIGGKILFVWIIRDISELKAMHKRMEQAQRLAAIGEMGASIAHEIRNPLAGISAATQILLKGAQDNPRQLSIFEDIKALITRMENTISQMLEYSRSWQPKKTPLQPSKLVQQVATEAHDKELFHNISFEFTGQIDITISLDRERMWQVIWNMYTNAAEAMPDGGTIHTNIHLNEKIFILSIRDEGCGIPKEDLDKLFTPFFTTKHYGTGLGMPICQHIIEAHQGNIQIDSKIDEGTTVIMRFPLSALEISA